MKKVILWAAAVTMLLGAVGLIAYPFVSDWVNGMSKSEEVVSYLDYVSRPPANKYRNLIESALEYNQKLVGEPVYGDPFGVLTKAPEGYAKQLSIPETDVMASLSIPKIGVELPVFHSTSDDSLRRGVGHVSYSSLPVGGPGTHTVLSAHTGSAGLRLFSDLNQLEEGDVFFVNCMGLELAYQVDQIKTVLPDDASSLQILPDKDYCTLVTCTPFGINSHRLLVRGTRVDLQQAEEISEKTPVSESTWNNEYIKAVAVGLAIACAILLIYFVIRLIARKRKSSNDTK